MYKQLFTVLITVLSDFIIKSYFRIIKITEQINWFCSYLILTEYVHIAEQLRDWK